MPYYIYTMVQSNKYYLIAADEQGIQLSQTETPSQFEFDFNLDAFAGYDYVRIYTEIDGHKEFINVDERDLGVNVSRPPVNKSDWYAYMNGAGSSIQHLDYMSDGLQFYLNSIYQTNQHWMSNIPVDSSDISIVYLGVSTPREAGETRYAFFSEKVTNSSNIVLESTLQFLPSSLDFNVTLSKQTISVIARSTTDNGAPVLLSLFGNKIETPEHNFDASYRVQQIVNELFPFDGNNMLSIKKINSGFIIKYSGHYFLTSENRNLNFKEISRLVCKFHSFIRQ